MSEQEKDKPEIIPEASEEGESEAAADARPEDSLYALPAEIPPEESAAAEAEAVPLALKLEEDPFAALTNPDPEPEPLPSADPEPGEGIKAKSAAPRIVEDESENGPVRDKVIVFEPCRELIHGLVALIEEKNLADIIPVQTAEEAIQTASQNLPCMLVLSINDNNAVGPNYKVFTKLDNAMELQGLKVLVVTPIKSKKLAFLFFKRFSVTEYVEEPIPPRTFQFKALQLLRAVESFRKEEREKLLAAGAKNRPPIQGARDIFFVNRSKVKKVGKNFIIDIEGPDPASGLWMQHIEEEKDPTCWRWVPNEEFLLQKSGELPKNGWVAYGNRPLANDESKTWNLSSEKLLLQYHKDGNVLAEKIGIQDDGFVFVAEDAKEENVLRLKSSSNGEAAPAWRNRIGEGDAEEQIKWNNRISEGDNKAPVWNDKQSGYRPRNGTFRNLIKPDAPVEKKPDLFVIKADAPKRVGPLKHIEARLVVRGIDFTDKKEIREIQGLKKFLLTQQAKNGQLRMPAPKKPDAKISIYRTILVAIADAFANVADPKERMETILNALETSYAPACASFTGLPDIEGSSPIVFRSRSAPKVGTCVAFIGGIAEPVLNMWAKKEGEPPLGYLFMAAMGKREKFTADEAKALKQIAARLSPLLSRKPEEVKEKKEEEKAS